MAQVGTLSDLAHTHTLKTPGTPSASQASSKRPENPLQDALLWAQLPEPSNGAGQIQKSRQPGLDLRKACGWGSGLSGHALSPRPCPSSQGLPARCQKEGREE